MGPTLKKIFCAKFFWKIILCVKYNSKYSRFKCNLKCLIFLWTIFYFDELYKHLDQACKKVRLWSSVKYTDLKSAHTHMFFFILAYKKLWRLCIVGETSDWKTQTCTTEHLRSRSSGWEPLQCIINYIWFRMQYRWLIKVWIFIEAPCTNLADF